MSIQRTHYVTNDDVTIGATVHGQGPPLVFLHGAMGDGDIDWQALLPHLTDQFTCHLPSMRGRGLSGDHPDLSLSRVIHDFLVYVDSIEEPTGLVGWSAGANWALAIAAQPDSVNAVAVYEPIANGQMDEREQAALGNAVARMGEVASDGDLTAAMRAFAAGYPFNDEDVAMAADTGYFDTTGRYVPDLLKHLRQVVEDEGTLPDDPSVLDAIQAPLLVLHGTDTRPFLATSARHVVDHVPNAQIQEVPGAGHAALLTHPEALAEALTEFFSPARQPA